MVRSFEPTPIDAEVLDRVLDAGRRAPSAGNSQGLDLLVLEGSEQTGRYWDLTLPAERRASFAWPRLLDAPVLVLPLAGAGAYLARYSQPDKAASGLGESEQAWPVPYWTVDASFAAMAMLLAAVDEGLGALFFGIFSGEDEVLAAFGVPAGHRPIGTIALGHPAAGEERPGRSAHLPRRSLDHVVHRGAW